MSEHGTGEDQGRSELALGTQTGRRRQDWVSTWKEQNEQLLPGMPDEITLDYICAKLPWRDFHTLSSVSHLWQHVIQSRQVYEARVRSGSTETVVVFRPDDSAGKEAYALYSTRENSCSELPPSPLVGRGKFLTCGCISLDGKIYVMGGEGPMYDIESGEAPSWPTGTAEVYVLDVAGQRQWKQCASMLEARMRFGCGVIDGKIYVFGGMNCMKPVCGSEVYDPKVDAWFPIKPMESWRHDHQVVTLGEELLVFGGMQFGPDIFDRIDDNVFHVDDRLFDGLFWDIYNPVTNEWRVIERDDGDGWPKFAFKGKLHKFTESGIHVYDYDRNLWADLVSFSPDDSNDGRVVCVAVPVKDELVALWFEYVGVGASHILQSSGFGGKNTQVSWQTVYSSRSVLSDFMCPIQL